MLKSSELWTLKLSPMITFESGFSLTIGNPSHFKFRPNFAPKALSITLKNSVPIIEKNLILEP